MARRKHKNDREISLFPDFDRQVAIAEAEKSRQERKAEQTRIWREQEEQFLDWLFADTKTVAAHQREDTKIAAIVTIDI